MDALYRENLFEVPRAMIDEQVQRLQVDAARRIGAKDASQVPAREIFEDQARRRAALGLLMGQIVQSEGIKVDRERVQSRLSDLIAQYPNPDEARRAYLQNADAMRQVESVVLEDQVVDWIVEHAGVTDKPMTFKDLTGFGQNIEQHSETNT
jgi:trigger factor